MQGDWPDADDHATVSEPVTDGGEREVKHVTLVRLLTADPRNGHDAGTELFRPGLYENGENYEVMTDDGGVATVETATVDVFEFSKPLPTSDALDRAVAQAKADDDNGPEVATDGGFAQPAPIERKDDRAWNDADTGQRLEAYADAVASVSVVEEIALYPGGALDAVKVHLPYSTTVDGRLLKPAFDFGLGVASLGTHHLRIVPGTEVHD